MPRLEFHPEKIPDMQAFLKLCPFGALSEKDGKVEASAACKMCRLCVKKGPEGAALYIENEKKPTIDKSEWNGVAVYVDHEGETIHPVTFELIGKARELAKKSGQPVRAVFIGHGVGESAKELLHYGIDEVLVYDDPALRDYIPELYTAVMEDCVKKTKPCAILVGATTTGRELAPRIAARFRTGLTADCTILDMTEEGDLIQIRPAFGGNIMAQIVTPNHRPQMATVRYKVMNAPERAEEETGRIVPCPIDPALLRTTTEILSISPKEKVRTIESADVIVAVGRGLKSKDDLDSIRHLASLLGAEIACTRPLVEAGWLDAKHQIGLSGRTVRPKLILCFGISGAVQFAAGMNNSDVIFAVNRDEKAPIFKVANYGIVGDLYEIVPRLIRQIEEER